MCDFPRLDTSFPVLETDGRGKPAAVASVVVSVITVVKNNRAGLRRTIQSVCSQTYGAIEFIVIDGGSTDGTLELIQSSAPLIDRWESRLDGGIYDAMNTGLAMASGDMVLFLNSGDQFLHSTSLQRAVTAAVAYPGCEVLYFRAVGPRGRRVGGFERIPAILFDSVGNHQAVLISRSTHRRYTFDTRYRIKADRHAQLRMYLAGCRMKRFSATIARCEGGGISTRAIPRKELENVWICWNCKVGLACMLIALYLAAVRLCLFGVSRLMGVDWERTKVTLTQAMASHRAAVRTMDGSLAGNSRHSR